MSAGEWSPGHRYVHLSCDVRIVDQAEAMLEGDGRAWMTLLVILVTKRALGKADMLEISRVGRRRSPYG